MRRIIFRVTTVILAAVLLLTGVLGGAMQAKAMDDIKYTDLFYGYDSSYLNSQLLQLHSKRVGDMIFTIYNDYCDSDEFKWTAVKDGIKAATNLSEFYKLMSDTYGDTDYNFEDAVDKANVMLASKLLNSSLDFGMADRYIEGVGAVQSLCEVFENENVVSSMDDLEVFAKFFQAGKEKQLWDAVGDISVNQTLVELSEPLKFSEMLSYVGDGYEAAKTIAVGLMLENLRMEIIDDIIANAPTDSTIYQGMATLKQQLRNGFVSYFIDNYVTEQGMEKINEYAVEKLSEFALGNIAVLYNVIGALVSFAATVVFDVIMDVPGVDDLTVQKVLDEYSSDLYLMLIDTKIPQFDSQFDSNAIVMYEAVFNTYLAASSAALEASEKLALDSNKAELDDIILTWGDVTYDNYIFDVKQTIATQQESERCLKMIDNWNLNSGVVICDASDDVEDGCAYMFNGEFRANVTITGNYVVPASLSIVGNVTINGRSIEVTIPEGVSLNVGGNMTVHSSHSAYPCALVAQGTLRVGGDFNVGTAGYYAPSKNTKLYIGGNFSVEQNRYRSRGVGAVIFNGTQQQRVYNLVAADVTVTNPAGIKYSSVAYVYGHYALNGNPLAVENYFTYMYTTTTFDDSNFTLVKAATTMMLNTDVKADVVVDLRNVDLTIAEGSDYTIDGNFTVQCYETSYPSELLLNGTLRVTGHFTIGTAGYYAPSENAKLYVGGYFGVEQNRYRSHGVGTVIFNGTEQQRVYNLVAADVTVTNPSGIKYSSVAYVYGHYALNGNPLAVENYFTYMYTTTTFDNSDFTLVKAGATMTLNTDVKADVVVDLRSIDLTVAEGSDYTIDGNFTVQCFESSYPSELLLEGTLRVIGHFTVGTAGYYAPSENAKLYVGGYFGVEQNRYRSHGVGAVIFNGTEQQRVYNLVAADVTVTNPAGIKYSSVAYVYGHYALNGNPLVVENYFTYMYTTTTFDDSNFTLVKPGATMTLNTDVKADVVVDKNSITMTVAEGSDYTIDGNLTVQGLNTSYPCELLLKGILRVTGNFNLGNAARLYSGDKPELYVGGNYYAYYSYYNGTSFKLVLNGTEKQTAQSVYCKTLILENTSEAGVSLSSVSCSRLFDHQGNVFGISGSQSFTDYDADGVLDNLDAEPTLREGCLVKNAVILYESGEPKATYSTLADALVDYDSTCQYLKLAADLVTVAELSEPMYIDLAGFDLSGLIYADGNLVMLMDSSTDDYSCDKMGYFTCVDKQGNAIVPQQHWKTNEAQFGSIKRYWTIEDDTGFSAHRFYLGIIHFTVKPNTNGVGYKALFAGDKMIQEKVENYGFTLTLGNFTPKSIVQQGSFVSGKTISLRVDNYDVDSFAVTPLSAQVFLTIDGETISSVACYTTLREAVELVNDHVVLYSVGQLNALKAMFNRYPVMLTWKVSDILAAL